MNSFCAILEEAAAEVPDKPLFVFPESRWRSAESLTYRELASHQEQRPGQSQSTPIPASGLSSFALPNGSRFLGSFLMGMSRSRVAAVPLNIPNLNRSNEHLQEVCKDCTPSVLITNQKTADVLSSQADKHPNLSQLPVITPEPWRNEPCEFAHASPDGADMALLQYTSGSTARPKGVQVSHGNLLANLAMIRDRMGIRMLEDTGVTLSSHYHDMGLIGSYLATLFTKNTSWCLQPEEFVLQPERWLQLISELRASVCGCPDFSYRCVEKIQEDQLLGIDLSSWRVAFIGSERIRPETIQRFTGKFSTVFARSRIFPLLRTQRSHALLVTSKIQAEDRPSCNISSSALMENRIEPRCRYRLHARRLRADLRRDPRS
ncbi:MAG: AMP-binding protein [Pirellulaceae bacterium]